MSDRELAGVRARMGMVFQEFNLWPHFTVLQNIIEAPVHVLGLSQGEAVAKAAQLLEKVGLNAQRDAYPYYLPGGPQPRVAIARALAMRAAARRVGKECVSTFRYRWLRCH